MPSNLQVLSQLEVEYESIPGWQQSLAQIRVRPSPYPPTPPTNPPMSSSSFKPPRPPLPPITHPPTYPYTDVRRPPSCRASLREENRGVSGCACAVDRGGTWAVGCD